MTGMYNQTGIHVVMQCGHCNNRTAFKTLFDYTEIIPKGVNRWYILQCFECSNPMFIQSYEVRKSQGEKTAPQVSILYPSDKMPLTGLPDEIEEKYREALKISVISPSSCAVQIRRTLEAICKHENASGRVLADKLKHLADSGRIPNTLVEVSLHLKQFGNLGAHFDEDEITKEDVAIILEFVELLLEYLYVAPARIETVRNRLNRTRLP